MNLFTLKLRAAANGMPVKAGEPVQLTNGLGDWHVHKGQWSPDGRRIIYTRDADQGNIFTIDNYK